MWPKSDLWGYLSYAYFNWRQDTGSDLFLFVLAFIMLVRVPARPRTRLWPGRGRGEKGAHC